jgi:hypothetical protein
MQNRSLLALFPLLSLSISGAASLPAVAQSPLASNTVTSSRTIAVASGESSFASSTISPNSLDPSPVSIADPADAEPGLPAAPEPAAGGDHYEVAPSATWHQARFSRIGIGANISPLGIGIEGAIVLNHYFDGRLEGNFFDYDSGRFEVDGFNVDAKLHMASAAAALDWYPFGSVWRISPGVMFFNGNQLSGTGTITPGSSFQLENQTYYSANTNPITGATPLLGNGALGLHHHNPAATRSDRHWSFPSEFGVIFTGAPTINVNVTGWACLDARQTQCSDVGDPANPIGKEFNNDLQARLNSWRKQLDKVQIYPIYSYSVVYSFNIR